MRAKIRSTPIVCLSLLLAVIALAAPPLRAVDVMLNVAGIAAPGYSGDGAPATSAKISGPLGVIEDASGNIFFCDSANGCVRRIDATTGNISTIAGTGVQGFSGDTGQATAAQLHSPSGIVFDATGNLYIADQTNSRIRKVAKDGTITTFAGNGNAGFGGDNGLAANAAVYTPSEVIIDPIDGSLVISQLNSSAIRRVDLTTNIITTLCGNGTSSDYNGDNILAVNAHLNNPTGIRFDAAGNLFIVDCLNQRVRMITRSTGMISTIAGTGQSGFSGDNGPASAATFTFGQSPTVGGDMSLDANGNIFLCDTLNERIRFIDHTTKIVTTIAGSGMVGYEGNAVNAQTTTMNLPAGILAESSGNYLISDYGNNVLRRVVRNSQLLPFSILSISPNHGGNTGTVTVEIYGGGIQDGVTVALQRAGQPGIAALAAENRFGLAVQATCDLTGSATGVYDVVVTNPGNATRTLAHAFTIEAGSAPKLTTYVQGFDVLRGGRNQIYTLIVENDGDTDAYVVPTKATYPSYLTMTPMFQQVDFAKPTIDPTFDFTKIPLDLTVGSNKILPLYFPIVPANGSARVLIALNAPDASKLGHVHFGLEFDAGTPLFTSTDIVSAKARGVGRIQANACIQSAVGLLGAAAGFVPGVGCAEQTALFVTNTLLGVGVQALTPGATADNKASTGSGITAGALITLVGNCAGNVTPGLNLILNAAQAAYATASFLNSCLDVGESPFDPVKFIIQIIVSGDPNDKSGPAGPGAAHYITTGTPMNYSIEFQNKPDATAAAQDVTVTDTLDSNLDPSTLSIGVITFADKVIVPPPGLSSFTNDVDLRPGKNLIARVTAGLSGGTITWTFQSLDPATLQPTADPTLGFLDPDKKPPQGEGSVQFTLKQKPNLAVGTAISNKATIVFDANSPIDTPTWVNTITYGGTDTDGDGFPDEFEMAAGSDPFNPSSTPFGGAAFTSQTLTVQKLQLKLDFSGKGKDSLQMTAALPPKLADGFAFTGKVLQVFIGGVYRKFTLDDKGSAKPVKTESASIKSGKTSATLSLKINETIASNFADEGLDASDDLKAPKDSNRQVLAIVLFNNTFYQAHVPLAYGSKKGKSGSAVVPKPPKLK